MVYEYMQILQYLQTFTQINSKLKQQNEREKKKKCFPFNTNSRIESM